jgi:uncharacterized protein
MAEDGQDNIDHYQYADRAQAALLDMVRGVMREAAKDGLKGAHHFYVTYYTHADGVVISDKLRAQHPEEITIVLQNQFEDLEIAENEFHVTLSFNQQPERLTVPFAAITKFYDPSVAFGLMFDVDAPDALQAAIDDQDAVVDAVLSAEEEQSSVTDNDKNAAGGEVVSLDSFRDK